MEALMQTCLRRTLSSPTSLASRFLGLRIGATSSPHANTATDLLQNTERSFPAISRPISSASIRLDDVTTLASNHSSFQAQQIFRERLVGCQEEVCYSLGGSFGTGGRGGSRPSWFAAGAFPFAVAAYSGVALAKEKASVSLPGEVVLYQYEACPFCNKVKAFLDYHDINYKVVEVNPIGKKELKWSEYKKVPVLVVDGEPMNDSTNIISTLDAKIYGKGTQAVELNAEEEKWRRWVDDYFVHLLSPNIYRTPSEALEAFDYITTHGNFSAWERAYAKYSGAIAMYFVGKRLKKKHNIEDERGEFFKAADEWVEAVGSRKFMGGDKPNLADLAVFGVLRPIRNMQTGRDLMANSKIGPWYERMESEVGGSNRLPDAVDQR